MKEFTVEVKDKALSKALQEVAFENGWKFVSSGTKVIDSTGWGIIFGCNNLMYTTMISNRKSDYTLPQDWNEVVAIISKPQFKVGDKVVYKDEHIDDDINEVKEIRTDGRVVVKTNKYGICTENPNDLRHATEQELTKKFFEWDVKDLGGVYKIGCREVGKGDLSTILTELNALYNAFGKNPKLSEIITELKNLDL